MRKVTLIILCLILQIAVFAKDPVKDNKGTATCAFSGKVLDKSNLEALTGAVVEIKDLDMSTYVSFDGSFSFKNLPAGTYTVVVKYVGYVDQTFEKVKIAPESGDYNFRLATF